MIKLLDILNEIGDATKAVPYRKSFKSKQPNYTIIQYEFKIGEDTYEVNTYPRPVGDGSKNTTMSVDFNINTPDDQPGHYYTSTTNKGVQYTVMATIVKILKDYIDQHPELVEIYYEPVKNTKNNIALQSREKLYKIYAEKNLPNWSYSKEGDTINLRKPGYTPSKSIFKRFFKSK